MQLVALAFETSKIRFTQFLASVEKSLHAGLLHGLRIRHPGVHCPKGPLLDHFDSVRKIPRQVSVPCCVYAQSVLDPWSKKFGESK